MNNIIKKVDISGFRSIESESINCDVLNVFCGANDSGKSNVLRALNLFFNNKTDFITNLKFSDDYNKVAFAKAVRATKMKQQIKIRVHINPPSSYTSLKGESSVYIERAYDRNGVMTEKYSNDKKKGTISRLFNKIQYIYIPALKGREVLQYILGLIGGYELIDQSDISALNDKISAKTNDLTEILTNSNISINTSFGLPTLLSDFWERLSVDTSFEKTDYISANIKGTGEIRELNANLFKIPLTSRGEGIKSKYIPPLLEWLNKNNPDNEYVWGIDEPENSLEFSLCEELSKLFYNQYAKNVQCFLTTHSLAFMNPAQDVKFMPNIYRCRKDDYGSTKARLLSDLFAQADKFDLFDDLGALNVQKELIEKFREYKVESQKLKDHIAKLQSKIDSIIDGVKCVVLTEDVNTELLESILEASGFAMAETDVRSYEGCTNFNAAKILKQYINEKFPEIAVLMHMDRDYKTDDEISSIEGKFSKIGIKIFFTRGTDIESHYINANHINAIHPEISAELASNLIEEAYIPHIDEAINLLRKKNFGDKHAEKSSHADEYIKNLPKQEPLKYVKGKTMYSALKQLIKDNTTDKINAKIHMQSPHIADVFLVNFAKETWNSLI